MQKKQKLISIILCLMLCIIFSISINAASIKFTNYACKGDTKVWVKVSGGTKGCRLVLKYGGKKNTYKFKKNHSKYYIWFKVPRLKVGKKLSAILYGADGSVLDQAKDIVYYYYKIKKGMTKKEVKKTPFYLEYIYEWDPENGENIDWDGMDYPDDIYYSSDGYTFWNWDDGTTLGFKNGRLVYWYI